MTQMTKKNVPFDWTEQCDAALTRIKELVQSAKNRILRHPDLTKPFYVVCDASLYGVGSVLMQKYGNLLEPCEYWSKLFGENERHWHVAEKELSAVVWSLEKWSKYLLGKHFYVYTDHKNIEHLHTKFDDGTLSNKKLIRWLLRMQEFDCTCYYFQ